MSATPPVDEFFTPTPAPTPSGETSKVTRGDLTAPLQVRGRIVSAQQATLSFRRAGSIKELDVKSGDPVKQGAVIAQLDDPALQSEIQQAQFNAAMAQADLTAAEAPLPPGKAASLAAAVDQAQRNVESAQLKLQKLNAPPTPEQLKAANLAIDQAKNKLWSAQTQRDGMCGSGPQYQCNAGNAMVAAAQTDVDTAQNNLTILQKGPSPEDVKLAQIAVASAQAALAQAKADYANAVQTDKANAAQQAATVESKKAQVALLQGQVTDLRAQLADLTLTAPFSGTIISLNMQVGDKVDPFQPVAVVADQQKLAVEALVPEDSARYVSLNQPARVTIDGASATSYPATVSGVASQPTVWQGSNYYQTDLQFKTTGNVPAAIQVGADVNLTVTESGVLLVPTSAVAGGAGAYYVDVRGSNGIQQVPVTVGLANPSQTQILSGLKEGDAVLSKAT